MVFLRFVSNSGRQCVYGMLTDEMKKYAHLAVASTLQASLFKAGGRRGSMASVQVRSRKIPECMVSPSEINRVWAKIAEHFEAAGKLQRALDIFFKVANWQAISGSGECVQVSDVV